MIRVHAFVSFTEVIMPQRPLSSRLMHTRIKQTRLMGQLCRQRKRKGSHNFHLTQHPLCLPPPSSYLCQIWVSPPSTHLHFFYLFSPFLCFFFFVFFSRPDSICPPTRSYPMNLLGGAEWRCISHICTCSQEQFVHVKSEWLLAGRNHSCLLSSLQTDWFTPVQLCSSNH